MEEWAGVGEQRESPGLKFYWIIRSRMSLWRWTSWVWLYWSRHNRLGTRLWKNGQRSRHRRLRAAYRRGDQWQGFTRMRGNLTGHTRIEAKKVIWNGCISTWSPIQSIQLSGESRREQQSKVLQRSTLDKRGYNKEKKRSLTFHKENSNTHKCIKNNSMHRPQETLWSDTKKKIL